MVSATDYPPKPGALNGHNHAVERPRKRRFRLFSALAAPFRDMDERALHKKYGPEQVERNNSKGNMFTTRAAVPDKPSVKRFRHD